MFGLTARVGSLTKNLLPQKVLLPAQYRGYLSKKISRLVQ